MFSNPFTNGKSLIMTSEGDKMSVVSGYSRP